MVTPVLIPHTEVKHRSADGTRKGRVGNRQNKALNRIYGFTKTPVTARVFFDMMGTSEVTILNEKEKYLCRGHQNENSSIPYWY